MLTPEPKTLAVPTTSEQIRRVGQARRRAAKRWVVAVKASADALTFAVCWVAAYELRMYLTALGAKPLNPQLVYWQSMPLVVVASLLVAGLMGNYTARQIRSPLEEAGRTFKLALGALLVAMSVGFLFKGLDISRAVVLVFGGLTLFVLPLGRALTRLFEQRLVKLGLLGARVLIVGAGDIGIRALQRVQDHPEIGYRVVGFVDDQVERGARIGRTPVLGTTAQLREIVVAEAVDEVVIALPHLDQAELMALVMAVDDLDVRVRVVADLFGVLSRETRIDAIEDVPIYDLKGPDESLFYRGAKRAFDLVIGGIGFVFFLLTLPLIALAIKLDSPGPVFFLQDRVGERGRIFRMWKYRTMRTDVDPYAVAPKTKQDPRVTRVGAFLRSTSLDELPQVINVLRGDMSIVGPRPEMPFIVEQYNDWQRKRLEVRPGITGLWQILGRKDLPLHENLEYDFYYIKNRSLFLDLVILAKTLPAILLRKGAY